MLGVPNLGLNHEQLTTAVKGQPNERFVKDLIAISDQGPSQFLEQLARNFISFARDRDPPLQIVSYYEQRMSPTLVRLGVILNTVR
jgi:hypothetical protein